jgi:hypothetical protein
MLSLIRVRQGRRFATRILKPLVDASRIRLGGIPDDTWSDPYVIGLLSTLVTLLAREQLQSLEGDDLGLVQVGAWKDITSTSNDDVGQDICILSMNRDIAFQNGYRTAGALFRAIAACGFDLQRDVDTADAAPHAGVDQVLALWACAFDDRICGRTLALPL